jgi:acetyl esterase/lipase
MIPFTHRAVPRARWIIGLLAVASLSSPVRADSPDAAVSEVLNQSYYDGPDRDARRNVLDLYLPKGQKDFPVLVFVHGGGWSMGSKDRFVYLRGHKGGDFGRFFARNGIGVVQINYRLSPAVKHPEHVKDVARAVAWVKQNVGRYGGDPDQLFVCGHSAGGHLVALLATDPQYLQAVGMKPADLRGVLAISGVYSLTGTLPEHAGPIPPPADGKPIGPGVLFRRVFGEDVAGHLRASPLTHVHAGLPPFLVASADHDLLTLEDQAETFVKALKDHHDEVEEVRMANRTHQTIVNSVSQPDDPLGAAMLRFIRIHAGKS